MARKQKQRSWRMGCLLTIGVVYLVLRLLFVTSTTGQVSWVTHLSDDRQRVEYSYEIGSKRYSGAAKISDAYNVSSGQKVTVKYWRIYRKLSSLSTWDLDKYSGRTLQAELLSFGVEYLFGLIAAAIAAALGISRIKQKT